MIPELNPVLGAQPVDSLFQQAQTAFSNQNFDQAYQDFEKAGDLYRQNEKFNNYLKCRVEMARCSQFTSIVSRQAMGDIIDPAIRLIEENSDLENLVISAECYQFLARYQWAINGQYEAAISSYDKALEICEPMGDSARYYRMSAFSDLSHVYSNQEKFDQALKYARDALTLSQEIYGEDHVENGARYYSLGFTYYRKGYFDDAIRAIRQGIQILEDNEGPEMQIGLGYNNLAAVYVAKLDQDGARQSSLAAEEILSKYLGPEHEAIGTIHWDLGSMYAELEKYDLAEENLKQAIGIFEKQFGSAYPQMPQLFHQLAFCYDRTGDYASAEVWHQKAYQLNLTAFGEDHPRTGESYRQLANHYLAEENPEKAAWALENGMAVLSDQGSESAILRAGLFEEQAKYWEAQEEYQKSAEAYDEAIKAICYTARDESYSVDQTFNPLYFTQFNSEKAQVLYRDYLVSRDDHLLSKALEVAREAHQGIRVLRNSYQNAESKLFLQNRARDHYDLMLEILFDLWSRKRDEAYLAEAWQISEQVKSLLLLEEIKNAQISLTGVPDNMLDSIRSLRQDLNFRRQAINDLLSENDSTGFSEQQLAFIRIRNRLSYLENRMEENYPSYHSLRMELSPVGIEEISQLLTSNTTLIEYYLGDSSLYIFTVDETPSWQKIKISENFSRELVHYREEMLDLKNILENPQSALSTIEKRSKDLFTQLFGGETISMEKPPENLIIIPDKELGYISFEALKNSKTDRYLIEEHTISYAYSATLYALEMEQAQNHPLADFAGFAPAYPPLDSGTYRDDLAMNTLYREGRYDLPGARDEVEQINELLGGEIWEGVKATEGAFKDKAPEYSLIHLSLHGLIDESNPLRSRLLFYRENEDQDGELNAYEIYNLNLSANLLVLSACNTAAGALQAGEGILSLSRAFAFAGTPNLVASLWRADDAATSQIMIGFYQGLKNGRSKAQALREAKINYLADQKSDVYKHPYFWSSFILVGENSSKLTVSNSYSWLVAIIVVSVISIFLYRRRKKFENTST